MGVNTRKWLNKNREKLREKHLNKTIIVCDNKVVKAIDGPLDPLEVNNIARKICKGREWSYTFLEESEEEYLL